MKREGVSELNAGNDQPTGYVSDTELTQLVPATLLASVKLVGPEGDHPSCSAEVMNTWSCTSTSLWHDVELTTQFCMYLYVCGQDSEYGTSIAVSAK